MLLLALLSVGLQAVDTTPRIIEGIAISRTRIAFTWAGGIWEVARGGGNASRVPTGREESGVQLFLNLLMNAAHAMPNGGLARISIEPLEPAVVVRIADTGCGIQPDHLARLGEPFYSSKPNGTGLGFPIARQIAIAHGGDVRIVATGNSGTTVEVTLPRLEVDKDGLPRKPAIGPARDASPR